MLHKIKMGIRLVSGKRPPGPDLEVYPDDAFLIAYPKSGNTWTRFLVGNLLYPDRKVDFLTIPNLVPHFDIKPSRFFREMKRPRVINCHEAFRPQYKRVIYVVRDPRDVVVSLYHFQRKRRIIDDAYPLDLFVSRFITGEAVRPPRLGSWAENVGSWLAMRENNPDFLFIRYEDLLRATESFLGQIAAFLHIDASLDRIAKAVERSSSQNMRNLEKMQGEQWHQSKDTRQDIPFVRSAKSGGWKATLSSSAQNQILNAWGHLIDHIGYESVTASTPVS
ncbi:MAG TPA: sulfotransferase domain-containing protein [Candidatus Sulfotelmatobacter sp.]|nr:sulfotransferase domain-containing protein [Candidatus Sulfotelmatobacter sp.]